MQQTDQDRLMWLTADRVLYAGLLGETAERTFGAYTVYVAPGAPNRVCLDGQRWHEGEVIVVPPFVPHRVVSGDRLICKAMVEAETVDPARLPAWLRTAGRIDAPELALRVRSACIELAHNGRQADLARLDFDRFVLGESLTMRRLDPRIAAALARLKREPAASVTAEQLAQEAGLSFSRFLHLFRQDTSVSLRNLRAWKRARNLLAYVTQPPRLTEIALDTGYPDSTHFSHSIRRFYGLKPRDIFAGSRRLTIYGAPGAGHSGVVTC